MRSAALAALLGALVLAHGATAYTSAGTPWPVTRLTVWNETSYRAPLAQAMAAWNRVGTRVRLVAAKRKADARVIIAALPAGAADHDAGSGTVGWAPAQRGRIEVRTGLPAREAAAVLAHELGHVLGLGHEERGCSVMSAMLAIGSAGGDCAIARCAQLEECLVQQDDAEGLRHLYEQRLPALRPLGVREASVSVLHAGQAYAELRWRSPATGPGSAVLVRAERGRCPATPYAAPLARTGTVALRPGAAQSAALPLDRAGAWCAGLWVQEGLSFLVGPATYVRLTLR